uniref:Thioredoxin domain-containing protein n=1 Tax=Macrostomum lignano TaxID=282301 RepID=A0A1I8GZB2_9PLAT
TATDDGGAADEGDSANPWTTGATVVVNASSYASVILDNETNAMLALYTPECGEPCAVYEKIADVFRHEGHHVVFGRARRDPGTSAGEAQRNPTLLWFPRGDKNNIVRYGGDVDLHEIVGFINDMTGSHRQPDGKLEPGAGRVAQIERLLRDRAADLVLGRNLQQLSEEVAQAASDLPHSKRYVFYYQRLLRQLMKGSPIDRVLERENAAIDQLLNGGGGGGGGIGGGSKMSRAERDEAHKLHNIISGVVDIIVDHLQGERQSAEAAAVAEKRRLMEEQQKRLHEEGELAGDEEEFTEQAEAVKATKEEL